ncbi:MAG: glycosyltransferase family 4 protein [Candidatus Brocadiaceae bacterium]|nr:glycosyltransferase family 4 protein [Candidatus Brocadiaceae bacterium]
MDKRIENKINRKKLCYLLPCYEQNTATHYFHLYELIERLGEDINISLVVENSSGKPQIKNLVGCYVQRFKFLPLRILELFILLVVLRLKGYKKFYIHYNLLPALIASIVTKILGGETYIWSCVENKAYFARWEFSLAAMKRKFLIDLPTVLAFQWATFLVTCSHFMARYYEKNFGLSGRKILVIPNWINTQRLNPFLDGRAKKILREELCIKDEKVILYLGTLGEHKGVHLLPSIVEKIKDCHKKVVFIIAGDGPYKEELIKEIERKRLKDWVRVIGSVPNRLVKNYFIISDIYIHPASREEFGRVLLEAMATGVPFVSTTGGGGVLAFTSQKQKEYITPVNKIDLFCDKILELLKDEKQREELRLEGFRVVADFTLEKTVERFKTIIQGG